MKRIAEPLSEAHSWVFSDTSRRQLVMGRGDDEVGIEAEQDRDGRVVALRIVRPAGVTLDTINRIPWARYFGTDRAQRATDGLPPSGWASGARDVEQSWEALGAAVRALHEEFEAGPRRPGRKGRTEAFYKAHLAEYDALVARGDRKPITTIWRRLSDGGTQYTYGTVWAWIDKAKRLEGRMTPGRPAGPTASDLEWISGVVTRARADGVSYIRLAMAERPDVTKNMATQWKKKASSAGMV